MMEAEQPEDIFSVVFYELARLALYTGLRAEGVRGGSPSRRITLEDYEVSISGCLSF
jgi:hypothetical protein